MLTHCSTHPTKANKLVLAYLSWSLIAASYFLFNLCFTFHIGHFLELLELLKQDRSTSARMKESLGKAGKKWKTNYSHTQRLVQTKQAQRCDIRCCRIFDICWGSNWAGLFITGTKGTKQERSNSNRGWESVLPRTTRQCSFSPFYCGLMFPIAFNNRNRSAR